MIHLPIGHLHPIDDLLLQYGIQPIHGCLHPLSPCPPIQEALVHMHMFVRQKESWKWMRGLEGYEIEVRPSNQFFCCRLETGVGRLLPTAKIGSKWLQAEIFPWGGKPQRVQLSLWMNQAADELCAVISSMQIPVRWV